MQLVTLHRCRIELRHRDLQRCRLPHCLVWFDPTCSSSPIHQRNEGKYRAPQRLRYLKPFRAMALRVPILLRTLGIRSPWAVRIRVQRP